MKLEYLVKDNNKYVTVKDIIISHFHISIRLLSTLKNTDSIYLNNFSAMVNDEVHIGDILTLSFDYEEDNLNIVPTYMDLDIIYEDDWYIIINKPAGIPVHPSASHYDDTISNGIRYYFNSIGLKKKTRPVNRIDSNTSGIVIFAKNEYIQEMLIKQMANKTFYKEYIAIVEGILDDKKGTINKPIARKEHSIIERCIDENGAKSITHYEVLEEKETNNNLPISIVKCILETGRTHQIRVHMSSIGHPIIGDNLYGSTIDFPMGHALHSYKVEFIHPIKNEKVSYTSKNTLLEIMS